MSYLELLRLAAPETIVVLTALVALAADLLAMNELEASFRRRIGGMIGSVGCVVAIGWMLALPQTANLLDGILVLDPVTQFVKIAVLGLTILTLILSMEHEFTVHIGEYHALVLLAAAGMMFLVSSTDVLMIFVSLELTSVSLYVLAAFDKRDAQSAEASLKYFLFGGMSAAFTLFGLSLLYGLAGSTSLTQIASAVHAAEMDPVLILALVMTLVGFGFKVAAAPFHLWVPDVYQGAPTPSAAFIASGSKVAGFFVLARLMATGFAGQTGPGWHGGLPVWVAFLAVIAGLSMLLGNFAAIVQTSVRRLLAYSAIAHAGYMLLGVMTNGSAGLASLMYYAITYGLTTLGAFGVVSVVQQQTGGDRLADFAGLGRRSPWVALAMMVFILSLAGIPPLAGFFGKFYLFTAALRNGAAGMGLLWLVVLAIALSAVSLYYYLQVLKQIFVAPAAEGTVTAPGSGSWLQQAVLLVVALAVLALGCLPEWLIHRLTSVTPLTGL